MGLLRWALLGLGLRSVTGLPSVLHGRYDDYHHGYTALSARQALPGQVDVYVNDNCRILCSVATCGGDVCPFNLRRDVLLSGPPSYADDESYNATVAASGAIGVLSKRDFTRKPLTTLDVQRYIRGQFRQGGTASNYDSSTFPNEPSRFAIGNTAITVAHSVDFSQQNTGLQWGSPGLHGCTMMFIVSRRGAWMAHFWEEGSFCGADHFNTVECNNEWNWEVVATMNSVRANSQPINFNLFNQADDNTRIIYMTPRIELGDNHYIDVPAYPNKLSALTNLIRAQVPGVRAETYLYTPLDYDGARTGPQDTDEKEEAARLAATTERGHCLFQ